MTFSEENKQYGEFVAKAKAITPAVAVMSKEHWRHEGRPKAEEYFEYYTNNPQWLQQVNAERTEEGKPIIMSDKKAPAAKAEKAPKAPKAEKVAKPLTGLRKIAADMGTGEAAQALALAKAQTAYLAQTADAHGKLPSANHRGNTVTLNLAHTQGGTPEPTIVAVKWLTSAISGMAVNEFATGDGIKLLTGLGFTVANDTPVPEKPAKVVKEKVAKAPKAKKADATAEATAPVEVPADALPAIEDVPVASEPLAQPVEVASVTEAPVEAAPTA